MGKPSGFCWPFILTQHVFPHAHRGGWALARVRVGGLELSRAMTRFLQVKKNGAYFTLHVQQYRNVRCIHDIDDECHYFKANSNGEESWNQFFEVISSFFLNENYYTSIIFKLHL